MAFGSDLSMPVSARDHRRGGAAAQITLVEYGDYECPSCGQAFPVLKQLEAALGEDLLLVFRHFPLTQLHPHAEAAAEAAEAADRQGRFWDMHDRLYAHQNALSADQLVEHARALGLDLERFAQDMASRQGAARIREDAMSGLHSGVNGTPTYFINGHRYDGAPDYTSFLARLRRK